MLTENPARCAAIVELERYGRNVASAIGRLLDELSWEGNARKYRGGGRGLENVLTAEVFQALDLLPRAAFLGAVLRAATIIAPEDSDSLALPNAIEHLEAASVEVLLGDLVIPDLGIQAQPDVVIESESSYVFVEAKRVRGGSFQEEQLARELMLTGTYGQGRQPVLLLVVGGPPPLLVKGHGRVSVEDAIEVGLRSIEHRVGFSVRDRLAGATVALLTWAEISVRVEAAVADYQNSDTSTRHAGQRTAATLVDAVATHS